MSLLCLSSIFAFTTMVVHEQLDLLVYQAYT